MSETMVMRETWAGQDMSFAVDLARCVRAAAKVAAKVAAKEKMRYALTGVRLRSETVGDDHRVVVEATDGRRLVQFSVVVPAGSGSLPAVGVEGSDFLLATDTLRRVGARDGIAVRDDGALVHLDPHGRPLRVVEPTVEGKFPDMAAIIDGCMRGADAKRGPVHLGFNPYLLGGLLDAIGDAVDSKSPAVRLHWPENAKEPLGLEAATPSVRARGALMPVVLD